MIVIIIVHSQLIYVSPHIANSSSPSASLIYKVYLLNQGGDRQATAREAEVAGESTNIFLFLDLSTNILFLDLVFADFFWWLSRDFSLREMNKLLLFSPSSNTERGFKENTIISLLINLPHGHAGRRKIFLKNPFIFF